MTEGRAMGVVRRLGGIALTTGAVIGALCLIITVVCVATSTRPLVVLSGSMSPEIPTGALAFATSTPVADVEVGDVVSVVTPKPDGGESRVTHRVVGIDAADGQVALVLKGDANRNEDPQPYVVDHVDRVVLDIPVLGRVLALLGGPIGLFLLGMMACGLLLYAFRPGSGRDARGGGRRKATRAALVAAPVALALAAGTTTGTGALFTDAGTVTSNAIDTHKLKRPTSTGCSGSGASINVTVPIGDRRYDYVARIYNSSGTQIGGDKALTESAPNGNNAGGTATAAIAKADIENDSLISLGSTRTYTIRIYSKIPNNWLSTGYAERAFSARITGVGLLGLWTANFSCGSANPGEPDPAGPTPPVTTACSIVDGSGNAVAGTSCSVTSVTCSPPWNEGGGRKTNFYVSFAITSPYNADHKVLWTTSLSSATGCDLSTWSWATSSVGDGNGQVAPVAGYACSSLPSLTATSPNWVAQTGSPQVIGQLYDYLYSGRSCT